MKALANSLDRSERDLLRETESARMAELSEDELVKLHKRIRRARNKYVGIYRREASGKVGKKGGRGKARPKNTRNAGRAEVFEDALARVSAELARAADATAKELKKARLAAANPPATWPGAEPGVRGNIPKKGQVKDRQPKGAGKTKKNASSKAQGARRQAKRDSR